MKTKRTIAGLISFFFLILVMGCNTDDTVTSSEQLTLAKYGDGTIVTFEISQEEIDGLIHMRIEEKLARDVYKFFGKSYNNKIFLNISNSEQIHMDAVKRFLVKYNIEDPIAADEEGIFPDSEFQQLYDNLITKGSASLNEALNVGVIIEELDIADLENQLENVVDNPDIIRMYTNLKNASENHLKAFNKCLLSEPVCMQ